MNIANVNELNYFLDKYPSVSMMEVLMVDINGIIRCKRIPRSEFEELFTHGIKGPASTVLLNVKGEFCDELNKADLEGDPDRLIKPIKKYTILHSLVGFRDSSGNGNFYRVEWRSKSE